MKQKFKKQFFLMQLSDVYEETTEGLRIGLE